MMLLDRTYLLQQRPAANQTFKSGVSSLYSRINPRLETLDPRQSNLRNRLIQEPKRRVRERHHTSHPERGRRHSATERRPARLGPEKTPPGPAVARRWFRQCLDYLETRAYQLRLSSHLQKSRGAGNPAKRSQSSRARERYV